MTVSCGRCVLSGRSLCDGPITYLEEFYRVRYLEFDLETSTIRRLRPTGAVES